MRRFKRVFLVIEFPSIAIAKNFVGTNVGDNWDTRLFDILDKRAFNLKSSARLMVETKKKGTKK